MEAVEEEAAHGRAPIAGMDMICLCHDHRDRRLNGRSMIIGIIIITSLSWQVTNEQTMH